MAVKQSTPVAGAFKVPARVQAAEALAAVRFLAKELPLGTVLRTLARAATSIGPTRTRVRQLATPPLTSQLSDVDLAIAWSIALYRALIHELGRPPALELVRRLVLRSGMRMMHRAFPAIGGTDPLGQLQRFIVPALEHAARHGLYRIGPVRRSARGLSLEIQHCHYAAICRALEVPELATCFCGVDGPFFAELCPGVDFASPRRIADGDPVCSFHFTLTAP